MKDLYSEDTAKVGTFLSEFFDEEQKYKSAWGKQAKRNVAFANGDQNINPTASPIMVNNQPVNYSADSRQNAYIGNEIEPIVRTLVSYMTRQKPTGDVYPDGQEQSQKNVANVANVILEAKYDLDHEYDTSQMAAFWALTTGCVWAKDYWDPNAGLYVPNKGPDGNVILDQEGNPTDSKTGNNAVAVKTAFEMTVDHSTTNFRDQPLVMESYMMDADWAKEAFDQQAPGYTGKAANIQSVTDQASTKESTLETMNMYEEMKYALPVVGGTKIKGKNKILVQECYIRPNRKYPKGRMLIKAGNQWVYDSGEMGSPYYMRLEEVNWHPYTYFQYEPYIGRFLGKSLVEQLIHLQVRLNEINGAILENANTLANPNVLAAENQLKKGILTGAGAKVYTYRAIPGAPPPTTFAGTPLPQQFFKEKEEILNAMVRIAGTNFVMQGQAPSGVSAASAISQLLENASSQQSNMMLAWEKFHERRYNKKLRVIHKFHKYPDENLDRYVKLMDQDALQNEVQDFVGQDDLSDGITYKLEYGSMIPKSDTAKRDLYKELGKEGLLGNIKEDPNLQSQMLERLGEKPFDNEQSTEVKKAKWENERIKKMQPVEVSPLDIDAIHLTVHVSDVQNPTFLENAEDQIKITADDHIQQHKQQMQEKKMAQMPPPPPPGAEGTPGPPGPPPA